MELASATPLDGHDYSNFRTAVGKLTFMAHWKPEKQFSIQQLSTQVLNSTTESKRAVKQLIRYLKGTQHTCLRLEPREMGQTGLGLAELFKELHCKVSVRLEMDSDSARHILQRRGPGGLKHIEIRWCQYSSGYERNVDP